MWLQYSMRISEDMQKIIAYVSISVPLPNVPIHRYMDNQNLKSKVFISMLSHECCQSTCIPAVWPTYMSPYQADESEICVSGQGITECWGYMWWSLSFCLLYISVGRAYMEYPRPFSLTECTLAGVTIVSDSDVVQL